MQRKAVSQQTEMNWSPVVVVVAARNASYPQGIAPSNATERCSRRWWVRSGTGRYCSTVDRSTQPVSFGVTPCITSIPRG